MMRLPEKGYAVTGLFRVVAVLVLLGSPLTVWARKPGGSAYLDGGDSNIGVILCHGRAQNATWYVVNPLRKGIHKKLGYHTLSLQMPAQDKSWLEYLADFPDAYREIQKGIDFLRREKGVKMIYLMGHSMGSRMATAFLAEHPDSGIAGFIGVGVRNGGGYPLDSNENLRSVSIPVLDVYGDGGDGKDERHAETRSNMVSEKYRQVLIPGASHWFNRHEEKLVEAVVQWLVAHNDKLE